MPDTDFSVSHGPSGVGFYLVIPKDELFYLTRETSSDEGEVGVLSGCFPSEQIYLDWNVNPRGPTIYRYYRKESGVDELAGEVSIECQPNLEWNPLDDPGLTFATNPKDAIVIFFAARLSQMVREGLLAVKNPNHAVKFPVGKAFDFQAPELPVVSVGFSHGAGSPGDVGHSATSEGLQIQVELAAASIAERDSLSRAVRGLYGELEMFMDAIGFLNTVYDNFREYFVADLNPQLFGATITFGTEALTFTRPREERTWQLLPFTGYDAFEDSHEEAGLALMGSLPPFPDWENTMEG